MSHVLFGDIVPKRLSLQAQLYTVLNVMVFTPIKLQAFVGFS